MKQAIQGMKGRLARIIAACVMCVAAVSANARTIIIADDEGGKSAMISADAPRQSWGGYDVTPGLATNHIAELHQQRGFMLQLSLDKIPKGYKITKAELLIPAQYVPYPEIRVYVWRVIADWGPGVCWLYRTCVPKKIEWGGAGATGSSSDRAPKPTAVQQIKLAGDTPVNVTPDVELWYTGAAPNNGWLLTVEDPLYIRLNSTMYSGRGTWKLRVTYEPQ